LIHSIIILISFVFMVGKKVKISFIAVSNLTVQKTEK